MNQAFTLEELKSLTPSFDPTSFDKIPDESVHLISQYDLGYSGIRRKWGEMQAAARDCIRKHLEAKHGRKVLSLAEYEGLRGLASIPTYEAVQRGEIIIL